jgi:flagellar FliL protein
MAEAAESPSSGGGAKTMLIGAALALILGGAGFYTVYAGMVSLPLPPAKSAEEAKKEKAVKDFQENAPTASFLPMEPIIVSLGGGEQALRQLQFVAQLEVEPGAAEQIAALKPRIRDVLNTYLRAVSAADVENPAALMRMRAQMLRRVQIVTGDGVVRDLLISEFILR